MPVTNKATETMAIWTYLVLGGVGILKTLEVKVTKYQQNAILYRYSAIAAPTENIAFT